MTHVFVWTFESVIGTAILVGLILYFVYCVIVDKINRWKDSRKRK